MIILYIFLAVGGFVFLGIWGQWQATKFDANRYPAPGMFVEMDGRKLHYISKGIENGPVVIFDHGCGIGSCSLIWTLVSDKVSEFARVISYDRAGYGWSDPGFFPRTNESAVEDLRTLIEKLNLNGPIYLVGHSYGGINIRLFAKKYPNLASGVVFVDATQEDEVTTRFPAKYVKGQMLGRKAFNMLQYLCYVGILRIMGKLRVFKELNRILDHFPKNIQPLYRSILYLNKTAKTVASEFSNLDIGYNQVRGATLGSVPLVVIKCGIVENLNGFSKEEAAWVKTALHDVAVEMSRLSENGELWIAENSGHNVHVADPEQVVKAIRKICGYNLSNKRVEFL